MYRPLLSPSSFLITNLTTVPLIDSRDSKEDEIETSMKLVIAGATGFVGTEVVRQAVHHPSITSVIALGRRATTIPEPSPKFKSVECDNFSTWPDHVKEQLKGADACIWCVKAAERTLSPPFNDGSFLFPGVFIFIHT